MDNPILNQITPYLSLGMLTVFLVFVLIGVLFGMGRGAKRAGLRLIIFGSLMILAFFLTPLIVNGTLNINFKIAGYTPREFVDYASERLIEFLQQNLGDYVVPFQDYIKDYALGIVLAALNIVVFYALYFVVKFIGWLIYAIVAHLAAPKRDKEGKKLPKHAGWGALIGAIQGVFLFVIFLFPINGLVGVVNHAAEYAEQQSTDGGQVQTQAVSAPAIDGENSWNQEQVKEFLQKMNGPLKGYNNFMKYSGIQFLSTKAFEYQMTVRVENGDDINLIQDLNSGAELFLDAKDVMKVVKKLENSTQDGRLDLSTLTTKDYQVLRDFINKAFDLQILNVANQLLEDMDKIFQQPFNDNLEKLPGTEIYANSIYGLLIKNNVTEREVENKYAKYADGLQAAVQYVGEQKLDLVRKDLINTIDFIEALNIYQVSYEGLATPDTMTKFLAQGGLGAKDYFNLSTAKLVKPYGSYETGEYLINVLGDRLTKFKTIQLIGQDKIDNLFLYTKQMDNVASNDGDLKNLIDGMIPLLSGKDALSQNGKKGNWEILGNDVLKVAQVARNYVEIVSDINREKDRLINEQGLQPDEAQTKAILVNLSRLVADGDNKYANVDAIAEVVHSLMYDFKKDDKLPIKDFAVAKLRTIGNGGYVDTLIAMLDNENLEQWKSTLHGIVDVASVMQDSSVSDLIYDIKNGVASSEDIAEEFVKAVADLEPDEVAKMITGVMDIPEAQDMFKGSVQNILNQVSTQDLDELKGMLGGTASDDEVNAIINEANRMKDLLDDYNAAEDKAALETSAENMLNIIAKYKSLINLEQTGD